MNLLLLFTFTTLLLPSNMAVATPAPQIEELKGGIEYSFVSSLNQGSDEPKYSDALRIGLFSNRGLPFGISLDVGFLNQAMQRYTRLGFFNYGKQPTISNNGAVDIYYRAEALSFNWKEAGNFDYSPGLELGVTLPLSATYGIGLYTKATLESKTNGEDQRWAQGDGPQATFWLGLSLLQMNDYRAGVIPE